MAGQPRLFGKAVVPQKAAHGLAGMRQRGGEASYSHRVVSPVRKDPAVASFRHPEVDVERASQPLNDPLLLSLDLRYQAQAHALLSFRPGDIFLESILAAAGHNQKSALIDPILGLDSHQFAAVFEGQSLLRLRLGPGEESLLQQILVECASIDEPGYLVALVPLCHQLPVMDSGSGYLSFQDRRGKEPVQHRERL